MADDNDTPMSTTSTPSSEQFEAPSTPYRPSIAELSPPNSRGPSTSALPTIANTTARVTDSETSNSKNINGKRVLQTGEPAALENATATTGPHVSSPPGQQQQQPGWAWQNKKAREEMARALDQIIGKDLMIGSRYGDPLMPPEEIGAGRSMVRR